MGKQSTAASSSIALLQERFRELQREKERRELMQQSSESARPAVGVIPAIHPWPAPGSEAPMSAVRRDWSLSLGLISSRNPTNGPKAGGATGTEPRVSLRARSCGSAAVLARGFENHSDVDTSLHL